VPVGEFDGEDDGESDGDEDGLPLGLDDGLELGEDDGELWLEPGAVIESTVTCRIERSAT
jgi:hypothetical protein